MLGFLLISLASEVTAVETKLDTEVVTIVKKMRSAVYSGEIVDRNRAKNWDITIMADSIVYHILPNASVIYDHQGKTITMDNLKVPCEAEIKFQPLNNGKRNALTVKIKKTLKGATKTWPHPEPE